MIALLVLGAVLKLITPPVTKSALSLCQLFCDCTGLAAGLPSTGLVALSLKVPHATPLLRPTI